MRRPPTRRIPPLPRPAAGSRIATSGETTITIGSPAISEEIGGTKLRFVITTRGGAAARCSLRIGGQGEDTRRGLDTLDALLRASGRRVDQDSRAGLLRAVSGLHARVKITVYEAGFAVITEVLQ